MRSQNNFVTGPFQEGITPYETGKSEGSRDHVFKDKLVRGFEPFQFPTILDMMLVLWILR